MLSGEFNAAASAMAAVTAIVALRYLVTSGAFAWWGQRRYPRLHEDLRPQIRREIGWSLLSAGIYGLPAGLVAWGWRQHGWTLIYTDANAYPLWWLPVSGLLCLFAHDTWFYWTHRLMHLPALFRTIHAVHHASRPPTAWAAMSFHPWEALTGAFVIPALVFVLPLHIGVVAAVLAVMTVMGTTNHMGWELFPARLVHGRAGNWLITATHHQLHHDSYRCNYGLYFRFWDRLCGTDHGLGRFAERRGAGGC
jgi:Delta7-sterol 5-desaturase